MCISVFPPVHVYKHLWFLRSVSCAYRVRATILYRGQVYSVGGGEPCTLVAESLLSCRATYCRPFAFILGQLISRKEDQDLLS